MLPDYFRLFSSYKSFVCNFMKITFGTQGNKGDFIGSTFFRLSHSKVLSWSYSLFF